MTSRKILFKLLGSIAGICFIGFGIKFNAELADTQKHGKVATVERITHYTERKQKGSTTYSAEFHFKTEDGQDIVQSRSFPEELLPDFAAGRPVQIVYLPNDPHGFVFAAEKPNWMMIVGGIGLVIAALLFA